MPSTATKPRVVKLADSSIQKTVHSLGLTPEDSAKVFEAMKAQRDHCLPEKKPDPVVLLRRCKYCRANFLPDRPQDKEAKFCSAAHRKSFWRYGGLPFDKMKLQIMKDVRAIVREEFAALTQPQTAK